MLQIHYAHQICQCHSHKKAVQLSSVWYLPSQKKHNYVPHTQKFRQYCLCHWSWLWMLVVSVMVSHRWRKKERICYFFIHSETDWHLWFCCCGQTWVVSLFILNFGLHVGVYVHLWFGLDTDPAHVGQRSTGVISFSSQSGVSDGMSGDCLVLKHVQVHGLLQRMFVNKYPTLFSVGLKACVGSFHHS